MGIDPRSGHRVSNTVRDRDRLGGLRLARADGGDDGHDEDEKSRERSPWPPGHVSRPLSRETLRRRSRVYGELSVKTLVVRGIPNV